MTSARRFPVCPECGDRAPVRWGMIATRRTVSCPHCRATWVASRVATAQDGRLRREARCTACGRRDESLVFPPWPWAPRDHAPAASSTVATVPVRQFGPGTPSCRDCAPIPALRVTRRAILDDLTRRFNVVESVAWPRWTHRQDIPNVIRATPAWRAVLEPWPARCPACFLFGSQCVAVTELHERSPFDAFLLVAIAECGVFDTDGCHHARLVVAERWSRTGPAGRFVASAVDLGAR